MIFVEIKHFNTGFSSDGMVDENMTVNEFINEMGKYIECSQYTRAFSKKRRKMLVSHKTLLSQGVTGGDTIILADGR